MNSTVKTIIFWVVILFAAVALWQVVKNANSGPKVQEINLSQFMTEVDQGTIKEINVTGMEVKGKKADGSIFHTTAPTNYFTPEMIKSLKDKGVSASFQDVSGSSWGWVCGTW